MKYIFGNQPDVCFCTKGLPQVSNSSSASGQSQQPSVIQQPPQQNISQGVGSAAAANYPVASNVPSVLGANM